MRLSDAQQKALKNAALGRPLTDGIHGMSAHGGLTQTIWALQRRGLLDRNLEITEEGRRVVAESEEP